MRRTPYRSTGGILLTGRRDDPDMCFITAEALHPAAYRTDQNTVSYLGGTRPPDSVVVQPSAAIFDTTMVVTGSAIIAAAYLAGRPRRRAVPA